MKTTKQDMQYLISHGYLESDIPQIKRAKAVEILGREKFFSSFGRCAFHYSACNENNGYTIYFDASKFFED